MPTSDQSLTVLQIIPTYKPSVVYGGTQTSVSLLGEMLAARGGCRVTVATTTADGKNELPVFKKTPKTVDGVEVFYFPRWTGDHSQFSPALLGWLWQNVRRFDAVHIHSWWNITVLFSVAICAARGVKPFLAPRGMLSPFSISGRFKPVFHRYFGRFLLKMTVLHATSEQERRECLALIPGWENENLPNFLDIPKSEGVTSSHPLTHPGDPMLVYETGVHVAAKPLSHPLTHPGDPIDLLFLSRIHQKKGLELLFEALADAPFDWKLAIAGDGEADYIEQLKNLAQKLGIADRTDWLGWVGAGERLAVFRAADLMVLPSHNENFANVVIESLAAGTPVLVSRFVGLSDYVLEKKLGWACDTTAESIREKLTEIAVQTAERDRISAACAAQVRADFDPEVLVKKYLAMYARMRKAEEFEG